jgi:hypothetical protein
MSEERKEFDIEKDGNGDYQVVEVKSGLPKKSAETLCKQLNDNKGWADRPIKY